MLTKDKSYDQTKYSCRAVIVNGEVWYRIEEIQTTEVVEPEHQECYTIPTMEERVDAIEGCLLEVISG
jgi:hypothetical protein